MNSWKKKITWSGGDRELQERASPSGVFAQSERNMKAQAFKGKKRGHKRDMSGTPWSNIVCFLICPRPGPSFSSFRRPVAAAIWVWWSVTNPFLFGVWNQEESRLLAESESVFRTGLNWLCRTNTAFMGNTGFLMRPSGHWARCLQLNRCLNFLFDAPFSVF